MDNYNTKKNLDKFLNKNEAEIYQAIYNIAIAYNAIEDRFGIEVITKWYLPSKFRALLS